jgi:hypothetical protein
MKLPRTVKIWIIALIIAAAFPPIDEITPGMPAVSSNSRLGGYTQRGAIPEKRENAGFEFILSIGRSKEIRYPQWIIQISVVLIIGGVLLKFSGIQRPKAAIGQPPTN